MCAVSLPPWKGSLHPRASKRRESLMSDRRVLPSACRVHPPAQLARPPQTPRTWGRGNEKGPALLTHHLQPFLARAPSLRTLDLASRARGRGDSTWETPALLSAVPSRRRAPKLPAAGARAQSPLTVEWLLRRRPSAGPSAPLLPAGWPSGRVRGNSRLGLDLQRLTSLS